MSYAQLRTASARVSSPTRKLAPTAPLNIVRQPY